MQERLTLTISRDPDHVRAAQKLRHAVFVQEMGCQPSDPDGVEGDLFDPDCEHLVLWDRHHPERGAIATARLSRGTCYTGHEFDVSRLLATGRTIAELGRTCLHSEYRGGLAGPVLFKGVLDHVRSIGIEYVIGTASFAGADPVRHGPALRALRSQALAPQSIRPFARGADAIATDDRPGVRRDMRAVPTLIKTYLRAGAWVGEGAWVDRAFNTVDVCIVMDMAVLRLPAGVRDARVLARVLSDV